MLAAIQAAADANPNVTFNSTSGQLTYTSPSDGASMADLAITLSTTNDAFIEGSESFRLDLTGAASSTGANVGVNTDSVTTQINDTQTPGGADDGPGEWNIAGSTSVNEGANASYTVSLSGQFGVGEVVTVELDLTEIDTNSSDYADVLAAIQAAADANSNVTFDGVNQLTYTAPSDGSSMADLTIVVPITNDTFIEGSEDFALGLSSAGTTTDANVGISNSSVTTTINDTQTSVGPATDGPGEWNISGPTDADEGSTAGFTVSLSGSYGVGEVVTVDLNLTEVTTNSADYADVVAAIQAAADANPDVTFNSTTGTLTYTSPSDGASMAPLNIDIAITDDAFIEGPESFSLSLSGATSTTGASVAIGTASVSTTINDTQGQGGTADGPAEWSITGPSTIDEGQTAQFAVALSGSFGAGEVVTVDLNLDALGTTNADYADVTAAIQAAADANPNVTFNAATGTLTYTSPSDGASMTPLAIDLAITDDAFVEGPEDFGFTLTNPTTSTGANVAIDSSAASVVTTIDDTRGPGGAADGPATWSITGAASVDEGASAQYTISLSEILQSGEAVTVDLALSDNSTTTADHSDFVAAVNTAISSRPELSFDGTTLTFTGTGAAMTDIVISLGATDDSTVEGSEDYTIGLSNPTTSTGAPVAVDAGADQVTTIINDTQGPGGAADGPVEWTISGSTNVVEGATASYSVVVSGNLQAGEQATVELTLSDLDTASTDYADFVAVVDAAIAAYGGPGNCRVRRCHRNADLHQRRHRPHDFAGDRSGYQ